MCLWLYVFIYFPARILNKDVCVASILNFLCTCNWIFQFPGQKDCPQNVYSLLGDLAALSLIINMTAVKKVKIYTHFFDGLYLVCKKEAVGVISEIHWERNQ